MLPTFDEIFYHFTVSSLVLIVEEVSSSFWINLLTSTCRKSIFIGQSALEVYRADVHELLLAKRSTRDRYKRWREFKVENRISNLIKCKNEARNLIIMVVDFIKLEPDLENLA